MTQQVVWCSSRLYLITIQSGFSNIDSGPNTRTNVCVFSYPWLDEVVYPCLTVILDTAVFPGVTVKTSERKCFRAGISSSASSKPRIVSCSRSYIVLQPHHARSPSDSNSISCIGAIELTKRVRDLRVWDIALDSKAWYLCYETPGYTITTNPSVPDKWLKSHCI